MPSWRGTDVGAVGDKAWTLHTHSVRRSKGARGRRRLLTVVLNG
jgi:hypothetical protein